MDQPARHGREDAKTALSASRHERALVVLTVLVGTVSTLLAATIVNVAFPALMQELHVGNDSVQWVATGFLAATTSTMLGAAWGIERYGERNVFIAAMVVFAASSILGMLAWNLDALIAARVLQGGAAGIVQPLSMVSLFRVFPPEARGRFATVLLSRLHQPLPCPRMRRRHWTD